MHAQCCTDDEHSSSRAGHACGLLGVFLGEPRQLVDVDSGRWFACVRCHAQVLLCRRCDRGQIYCSRLCSDAARHQFQCEAGQRYQRSWPGRVRHAARSRRWRQRQRLARQARLEIAADDIVTHQGSLAPSADAPLAPCDPDPVEPNLSSLTSAFWRCRRCGCALSTQVRSRFLRYGPGSPWPPRPRDHSP